MRWKIGPVDRNGELDLPRLVDAPRSTVIGASPSSACAAKQGSRTVSPRAQSRAPANQGRTQRPLVGLSLDPAGAHFRQEPCLGRVAEHIAGQTLADDGPPSSRSAMRISLSPESRPTARSSRSGATGSRQKSGWDASLRKEEDRYDVADHDGNGAVLLAVRVGQFIHHQPIVLLAMQGAWWRG